MITDDDPFPFFVDCKIVSASSLSFRRLSIVREKFLFNQLFKFGKFLNIVSIHK